MKFLLGWVATLEAEAAHFHMKFAPELGIDLDKVTWEMNEANWSYTCHQLAAAHGGSTAEALAAMLPCPCVYQYVGQNLLEGPRPPNPIYAAWIEFYGAGMMTARPIGMVEAYDDLASLADPATLARCERNYLISSRYEWMFWDAAYHRRMWPA